MYQFIRYVILACFLVHASGKTFISYAALGDSYASGNGAGYPENLYCGRFSEAYPIQVARQLILTLKNLACAGAITSTILTTQVPFVGNSEVVSVQVGGNEADFFGVLNACVKQWFALSSCDDEVATAHDLIESTSCAKRFDHFVRETKRQLDADATLLVLGYARFFNDQTDECDHITFSKTDPRDLLTKDKRRALNQLITSLNQVIRVAAETNGAIYVDIDIVFESHRFCETGAIEPFWSSSWFFNDAESTIRDPLISNIDASPRSSNGDFFELTRTFHPTLEGHTAVANELVRLLREM